MCNSNNGNEKWPTLSCYAGYGAGAAHGGVAKATQKSAAGKLWPRAPQAGQSQKREREREEGRQPASVVIKSILFWEPPPTPLIRLSRPLAAPKAREQPRLPLKLLVNNVNNVVCCSINYKLHCALSLPLSLSFALPLFCSLTPPLDWPAGPTFYECSWYCRCSW